MRIERIIAITTLCLAPAAFAEEPTGAGASTSAASLLQALNTKRERTQTPAAGEAAASASSSTVLLTGSPSLTAQLSHPAMPPDLAALGDGTSKILIPPVTLEAPEDESHSAGESAAPLAPPKPLAINTADADEIRARLKLDPRRARLIVAFRKVHGRFHSPEDLAQVAGLSDEQVLAWEDEGLIAYQEPPGVAGEPASNNLLIVE